MKDITKVKKTSGELNLISADELFDTMFTPQTQIIEGLLQDGLYILAGAPKVGKSFLAAQIAYHVSVGKPLWNYPVHEYSVLYLALEDSFSRIQQRLSRSCELDTDFKRNLFFATQSNTLEAGLIDDLEDCLREHPNLKLIIIDPFQLIRGSASGKYSYSEDYEIMGKLKDVCDEYGVCILLVHHTRKKEAADTFTKISGSTGILGAVDGAFVMSKEDRTGNQAILEFTGRDLPEQRLLLEFDREHLVWNLQNVERQLWKSQPDPILEKINNFLKDDWQGTATDLIEEAQLDSRLVKPNTLTRKLNVQVGNLLNDYHIEYISRRGHERQIYLKRVPNDC